MPAADDWRRGGADLLRLSTQWQQQREAPAVHQPHGTVSWASLASGWLLLTSGLTDISRAAWQRHSTLAESISDNVAQVSASTPLSPAHSPAPITAGMHAGSVFGLPMAAAEMTPHRPDVIEHNGDLNVLIATGDAGKKLLLSLAAQLLRKIDGVDERYVNRWQATWRIAAAHTPIVLIPGRAGPADIASVLPERNKRISFQKKEQEIIAHIRKNCAFESEITDSNGLSEGEMLIFYAQRVENPFRLLYPDIPDKPSTGMQYTAQGLNFVADTITLGLKPVIGSLIANYLRGKYFAGIDDKICGHRQVRLSLAQLATALEVDNPMLNARAKHTERPPLELNNAHHYQSPATYFLNNKNDNVRSELILTATPANVPADQQKRLRLRPAEQDEFDVIPARSDTPEKKRQRLQYDQQSGHLRDKNAPESPHFLLEITEGETLITLAGHDYPLRINDQHQYEILIRRANREQWLAVYQEMLSKTWHLTTKNHYPVTNERQFQLLEQIKIRTPEAFQYRKIDNLYPHIYGHGKLYEVRNKHDHVTTTAPLFLTAELHGMIVPVRTTTPGKSGVRYEIYAADNLQLRGHPITWDGERWYISTMSSRHISHDLHTRITPQMLVDVDERSLSTTDGHGIRWNVEGQGYIKVRDRYVPIFEGKTNYVGSPPGKRIFVYYKDRQFHPLLTWPKPEQTSLFSITFKNELIRNMQEYASSTALLGIANRLLPSQQIHLEQVPASDLAMKRFIIFTNDEQLVVETSTAGKQAHVLTDEVKNFALSKQQRRFLGGNVRHISILVRNGQTPPLVSEVPAEVEAHVQRHIKKGAERIESVLQKTPRQTIHGKQLILCHADFLATEGRSKSNLASPQAIYEALAAHFIPLSQRFPNAIIAPGSIRMAQRISENFRLRGIRHRQGSKLQYLDSASYFWATLAPVFHQGKVIALTRKGEPLISQGLASYGQPEPEPVTLSDLDTPISDGAFLCVSNSNPTTTLNDDDNIEVFVGKTLLPGERKLIEEMLFPTQGHPSRALTNDLFSNAFMLSDEKFLLVVEDEFKQYGQMMPTTRSKVYTHHENQIDMVFYDWILHPAAGERLDNLMSSAADNYLYADGIRANDLSSKLMRHVAIVEYWKEERLASYEYHDISSHSRPLPQAEQEPGTTGTDAPD